MKRWTLTIGLVFVGVTATNVTAQFPTASKEHEILKLEEGEWDAQVTLWMGPAGPFDES